MTTTIPARLRKLVFAVGFLSLGALGSVGVTAVAGGGPGGHSRGGGAKALMMGMSQLDLTEDQEAQLEAAVDDVRERMKANRETRRTERDALRQQLEAGTLDRATLHTAVDDGMASAAEDMHYGIDRIMDVYETLTPEQKAELSELVAEHAERRSERGERGERQRRGGHDRDAGE